MEVWVGNVEGSSQRAQLFTAARKEHLLDKTVITNLLTNIAWSRELLEVPETQFIPPNIHPFEKKEKASMESFEDHAAMSCICSQTTFCHWLLDKCGKAASGICVSRRGTRKKQLWSILRRGQKRRRKGVDDQEDRLELFLKSRLLFLYSQQDRPANVTSRNCSVVKLQSAELYFPFKRQENYSFIST